MDGELRTAGRIWVRGLQVFDGMSLRRRVAPHQRNFYIETIERTALAQLRCESFMVVSLLNSRPTHLCWNGRV